MKKISLLLTILSITISYSIFSQAPTPKQIPKKEKAKKHEPKKEGKEEQKERKDNKAMKEEREESVK